MAGWATKWLVTRLEIPQVQRTIHSQHLCKTTQSTQLHSTTPQMFRTERQAIKPCKHTKKYIPIASIYDKIAYIYQNPHRRNCKHTNNIQYQMVSTACLFEDLCDAKQLHFIYLVQFTCIYCIFLEPTGVWSCNVHRLRLLEYFRNYAH